MAGVFISYRQDDSKAWAAFLRDELAEVFDADSIFLDRDTLRAGSWRGQIDAAVAGCSVTLVVIGKRWLDATDASGARRLDLADDVHRHEIASALLRAGMSVIPVLVDDAAMPRADQLPGDIRALTERQARRFSDSSAYREVDLKALVADIEQAGGPSARRAVVATATANAPPSLHWLPFKLDEAQARAAFAKWAAGLLMAPKGFAAGATVERLAPAWAPVWLASVTVSALWRGQRGETRQVSESTTDAQGQAATRQVSRTEWTDVQGNLDVRFDDVVVGAGVVLADEAPALLDAAAVARIQRGAALPDASAAVKPATVERDAAQSLATEQVLERARQRVRQQIGGAQQTITQLDVRHDRFELTLVHCPLFEGSYTYEGRSQPLTVNADSAAVGAPAPLSKGKVGAVVAVVLLLVLAVIGFFWLR